MLKINIIDRFSSRISLKKFSDKIFLDNNLAHLLEKFVLKNMYNGRIIALSKTLISWFLDCLYFSSFTMQLSSCWKLQTSFRKCIIWYDVLSKQAKKKSDKKCKYIEKRVYNALSPIQNGPFPGCSRMGGGAKRRPSLKYVTYILQWWNLVNFYLT